MNFQTDTEINSFDSLLIAHSIDLTSYKRESEPDAKKKRELIVQKEHERRSKLNSYFGVIKDLLPEFKGNSRLTKEKVLIQCREYIQKLQSQISYSPNKVFVSTEPFTSENLTQEEIDHAFFICYSNEFTRTFSISTKEELETRLFRYDKLIELADKGSKLEHRLAAANFAQYCYMLFYQVPTKTFPFLDKTYELIQLAKKDPKIDPEWFIYGGVDLESMVLANYSRLHLVVGHIDKHREYHEKAIQRSREIKQEMAVQYVEISDHGYRITEGSKMPVEEAEALQKLLASHPLFDLLGFIIKNGSLIENSSNPESLAYLLPKMGENARQYATLSGTYAECYIMGLYAYYARMADPAKAMVEIDAQIARLARTGIITLWNLSDLYLIKADCIMRIHGEDIGPSDFADVEKLLEDAVQVAEENDFLISSIKALTWILRTTKDESKRRSFKAKLEPLIPLVAPHCSRDPPPFLAEALAVLD